MKVVGVMLCIVGFVYILMVVKVLEKVGVKLGYDVKIE